MQGATAANLMEFGRRSLSHINDQHLALDRAAKIPLHGVAEKHPVLYGQGPIEPQRLPQPHHVLLSGIIGQHQHGRIASQAAHEEDEHGEDQQSQERLKKSSDNILVACLVSLPAWCGAAPPCQGSSYALGPPSDEVAFIVVVERTAQVPLGDLLGIGDIRGTDFRNGHGAKVVIHPAVYVTDECVDLLHAGR